MSAKLVLPKTHAADDYIFSYYPKPAATDGRTLPGVEAAAGGTDSSWGTGERCKPPLGSGAQLRGSNTLSKRLPRRGYLCAVTMVGVNIRCSNVRY